MELIFFIMIGIGAALFLRNSSGSGESINTSSAKSTSKHQFVITPGKWDEWNVSFNKEENKWVTDHHLKGDLHDVNIPTGIYLTREHIELFFKGIERYDFKNVNFDFAEEESPDYQKWTSFLKKDNLFKDWFFDGNAWGEMIHIHDFFWSYYNDPPAEFNYSESSYDIEKKIDLFIAFAQKGSDEVESDVRYLTSDLEVLLFDDPNQRQYRDYTEESEEYVEEEDDPFVTDVQFSRETIELLMRLATETYIELGSSLDDLQVNEEKYFVHWLEKVKKLSDFDTLWFPDKDKVIGRYYAPDDNKEVSNLGVEIFYNGKMVKSLWTELWGGFPYSPMLNVYHDWDELGPMEIDEVVDEFIEDYVGEDGILDDDLFYMSRPSNAPVKASTITI